MRSWPTLSVLLQACTFSCLQHLPQSSSLVLIMCGSFLRLDYLLVTPSRASDAKRGEIVTARESAVRRAERGGRSGARGVVLGFRSSRSLRMSRSFELDGGDRIGVSALEGGLSVHGEGARELGGVGEPCPVRATNAAERTALDGAQNRRADHPGLRGGLCKGDHRTSAPMRGVRFGSCARFG